MVTNFAIVHADAFLLLDEERFLTFLFVTVKILAQALVEAMFFSGDI